MTGKPDDTEELEAFFRAARSWPEVPDSDLLARVLAAAEAEQAAQAAARADRSVTTGAAARGRPSAWERIAGAVPRIGLDHAPLRLLGGWPVTAGFVAATCAGIWIGTLPQNPISDSGLFVVSDAAGGLEAWGEVAAFGLVAEDAGVGGPAGAIVEEDM